MLKAAGLILNEENLNAVKCAEKASVILRRHQILTFNPQTEDCMEKPDLIITFGGDGTLLIGARYAMKYDIPLLGINLGTVGFLTEEDPEHLGEKAIGMTRAAKSNLRVGVQALRIEVSGLTANEPVALLDLQGRVIASRRASSSTMQFEVRNAGRYIVKTQKESSLVLVK